MSNLEHYFENLLYYGEDIKGEANKNALTEEQQKSVEQCAQYVIYSLFGTREHFDEWINREPASQWHRVEDQLPEPGQVVLVCTYFYGRSIYAVAWLDNEGKWSFGTVTHWMPIEPPKEDA